MKTISKVILFCLLLTSFLSLNCVLVPDTNTLAYCSDVETSTENMLIAGLWNDTTPSIDNESLNDSDPSVSGSEADLLKILKSSLVLSSGKQEKSYWNLKVKGTSNITIDKVQIWWNNSQVNNSHMERIIIDKNNFSSGSMSSGELIDGTDYSFNSNGNVNIKSYFDSDVSYLTPFTINITMRDGSVKSYVTT